MKFLRGRFHRCCLLLILVLPILFFLQNSQAVELRQNGSQVQITPEMLKSKIDALSQDSPLDEATKTKLLELYRKGLDNLTSIQANNAQISTFVDTISTSMVEMKKLHQTIKRLTLQEKQSDQAAFSEVTDTRSLNDLEQALLQAKVNNAELEVKVSSLTRQSNLLNDRPGRISQRLAEIRESEDALVEALQKPRVEEDDSLDLTEARNLVFQTQLSALQSESRLLNQELVSMPVTIELLNLQRDESASRLALARQQVQTLVAKVNRKRQEEAAQSVRMARELVARMAGNQPLLQQIAQDIAAFSEQLVALSATSRKTSAERDRLDQELKRINEHFETTKQKVEMAGMSQAQGLLLHEMQRNLPGTRLLIRKLKLNQQVIAETGFAQVQMEEERKQQDDNQEYIKKLTGNASPETVGNLQPELGTLLNKRAELLDKIISANRSYLGKLSEIEVLSNNLLDTVEDFNRFLSEHLLWIRSSPMLKRQDLSLLHGEVRDLLAPSQWTAAGQALLRQAAFSPLFFLALLASGCLLLVRQQLISRLEATVNLAGNPVSYHFGLPLKALAMTLLLAVPLPLLLGALGWQLQSLADVSDFSRSVGGALFYVSLRFFYLRAIMVFLRRNGVATRIFFWPKESVMRLRREVRGFMLSFLPLVFFSYMSFFVNYRGGSNHILGRLIILLILAVITCFAVRLLHPRTGIMRKTHPPRPRNLWGRFYPLFFAALLILPLVLAVLLVAGYIFAAAGLLGCLINTIWLTFALVVGHQLLQRWLIQSSRQIALKKSRNRAAQEAGEGGADPAGRAPEAEAAPEDEENLVELSMDSRRLLNALVTFVGLFGLLMVWLDVLPALRMLNRYTLWTSLDQINGHATAISVTVADACQVVLIGGLTLVGTRNLPSLLKIILLKQFRMSTGSLYTVVTLTSYGIGTAGFLYIFNILGFRWSQIQWLVAALGVGIGFGLQEIVANFISGILILFERPIRVGDVVTVGTTDGVVTRIRIRATTIRDFDGKELLVPNKEFISGRLLNWSLSDPIIRILLPVGVAYGSDVNKAMQMMRQVAENNPLVLDEPKPTVSFDSFGDSALLLHLRCYIGSVDDLVRVRTSLHLVIDESFRSAGINIAFPQQDVHLDTAAPLAVHLVREKGKKEVERERPE